MENILWSKLPDKDVECQDWRKRVLFFDPVNIPTLFIAKPFQRTQIVFIENLFPPNGNICGCGCGQKIIKPRRRWATNECEFFASSIRLIVYGAAEVIGRFLRVYYGWKCCKCGCGDKGHDMGANGNVSWIKIDHIIPVKLGGGACWLSNYQLVCHDCHVNKTNNDFGWKQPEPESPQIKIIF